MLPREKIALKVAAKFYKAVVQAVLLYGSETWNLTKSSLARLEGFHVRTAYKMARKHQPKWGANGIWVYTKTMYALGECGMLSIAEYIQVRCQTITTYVVTRPILADCTGTKWRRGSMPHQWWWEQLMCLDAINAIESDASSDRHLVASTTTDM